MNAYITPAPSFKGILTTPSGGSGGGYTLPIATSSILGGVKIGANIAVAGDGTISVAAPGGGFSANTLDYAFSTGISAPPSSGRVEVNNAVQTAATHIFVHDTTFPGNDAKRVLLATPVGETIVLQDQSDSSIYQEYQLQATPVDNTTWVDLTVTWLQGGTAISNNRRVFFMTLAGAQATVSSVFGRTGVIVATAGDYTAAQVGAVSTARQVMAGTGLTGGGDLSADRTLAVVPDTTNQQIQALLAGSVIGTRRALNFIPNIYSSIGMSDDAANNRVNININCLPPVTSVFSRAGAVIAQTGDYTAAQVTNAVDQTSAYANPAWITSLAWSKITGAPAVSVTSVFGRTGDVIATAGDYTAAQVTNAADRTASYTDPAWIASLSWGKITGAPSVGSYQTPWLQNIDGGNFQLGNAARIGVGVSVALTTAPFTVGYASAGTQGGIILIDSANTSASVNCNPKLSAYGSDYTANTSSTGQCWYVGNASGSKDVYLANPRGGQIIFHNGAPRITVGTTGSVGIAQASPVAPLHLLDSTVNNPNGTLRLQCAVASANDFGTLSFSNVATSSNITAAMKFRLVAAGHMAFDFLAQSSGQTTIATLPVVMTLLGNGSVGIGTAGPTSLLHCLGSSPTIQLVAANAGGYSRLMLTTPSQDWRLVNDAGSANKLQIANGTASTIPLTIDTSGNVGIGTTSPQGVLHVAGGNSLLTALASQAIADGNMTNSTLQFYLDEAGGNLKCRVKYSNGTLKTATMALA